MKPDKVMRMVLVISLRRRDALGLKRLERLYTGESNGSEKSCSLDIVEVVSTMDGM